MGLDLTKLEQELAAAPLESPYPVELALAVVNDCVRLATRAPIADEQLAKLGKTPRAAEQLGMLAHLLASTSLRAETTLAMRGLPPGDLAPRLCAFLAAIEPVTAEMIRANAFRREEVVRRWAESFGVSIFGETPAQAEARLAQLDYRKTLSEYASAEKARKAEEARRAKLLAEAQARETAARGWRE